MSSKKVNHVLYLYLLLTFSLLSLIRYRVEPNLYGHLYLFHASTLNKPEEVLKYFWLSATYINGLSELTMNCNYEHFYMYESQLTRSNLF